MELVVIITLLVIFFYSLVVFFLWHGLKKAKEGGEKETGSIASDHGKQKQVTVIIPFRNEVRHLADLVGDLTGQSYPSGRFEVIFINDHSEDGSKEMLESLILNNQHFNCMDLPPDRKGKKEALSYGISRANSKWILQTDADCRVGKHFIASHMSFLKHHPSDMVAGMVTTLPGKGKFVEALERLDLLSLVGSGAGSFHYGRPVMCNGANLLYSRELFTETRKFDPSGRIPSGDDMFLLIGARKLDKIVSFSTSAEALVQTTPASSLKSMITQRTRWGSKAVHYGMIDIQMLALVVAITNLLVLCSPLWLIWVQQYLPLLLGGWALKTGADFSLLHRITGYTGQRKSLRWFFPVSVTYYFIQPVILFLSLFGSSSWKERI